MNCVEPDLADLEREQYAWENKGSGGSSKTGLPLFKWRDTDTGKVRIQHIEPGKRAKKGEGKQPPAPVGKAFTVGGKPPSAKVDAALKSAQSHAANPKTPQAQKAYADLKAAVAEQMGQDQPKVPPAQAPPPPKPAVPPLVPKKAPMSAADMTRGLQGFLSSGKQATDAQLAWTAAKLGAMSMKDLRETAAALKVQGGKSKQSIADNLVARVKGLTKTAAEPKPQEAEKSKPTSQSVADFKHPPGFSAMSNNRPNEDLPDQTRPVLDAKDAQDLERYTGFSGYGPLNNALRSGKIGSASDKVKKLYAGLQKAFDKAGTLEKPVKVYRGMTLPKAKLDVFVANAVKSAKSGGTIKLKGYTSTTSSEKKAHSGSFGNHVPEQDKHKVLFEIEANRGLDMKPYSGFVSENEMLLDHGSEFQVVSAKMTPDGHVIRLRQR